MGVCVYCGKSAGWFNDRHEACVEAARKPFNDVKDAVHTWVYGTTDSEKYVSAFLAAPRGTDAETEAVRRFGMQGFNEGLAKLLHDKTIGSPSLTRIGEVMETLKIKWDEVDKDVTSAWRKQKTIYHVKRKEYDKTGKQKDGLSIRFLKGEKLLWGFHGVDLREEVKRKRVGKSAGVRVRLGKRTTVNLGRSEGHWEETIVHPVVDTGVLAVTQGRVYFAGGTNSFHIDIEDIESLSYGNRSI